MKALLIIFTSLLLFGCIEEGTIVYDQDYPEAPENIGGSGSGADRAPGDGAGSAGGTSDGSGSTRGSSDGSGVDGGATSTGSDGSTTGGDGSGDGSTGGSTGGSTSGGTGTDSGDTSTGSSDGSGSTGGSTDGGSGSGDTGGDTGSSSTGGDTSTGSDGGETGSGSSDGSGTTGGSTDGGSGDGAGDTGSGSGGDGGEPEAPEVDLTGITPTIKAFVDGNNIATTYTRVDGADNYTVYYSTTSPAYQSGNIVVRTNLRYTVFNPPAGERYYFQVVANAPGGNSEVSAEASAMIDIPEPEVSPVDNISTTISADAAAYANNVSWDALDGAEGYTVYYSTSSPAFPGGFTSDVDNATTSFVHSGLDAGTTYYYQVVATHTLGDSDASNVADATPYADLTGITPAITADANDTDLVTNWAAVDGAESYRLYYSTVAPAYPGGAAVEVDGTSYTLVKPDVETTYYFQVRAIATGGNSNISNMADAIVNIDCPDCGGAELDAPTVTLTSKEQKIVVTWSPVDNATSYNLTWVSSDGTENKIGRASCRERV